MKSAVVMTLGVVLLLLAALLAYTCGGEPEPVGEDPYFSDQPKTEITTNEPTTHESVEYESTLPKTGGIKL